METNEVEGKDQTITNVSSNDDNTDTTKDAIEETLPLRIVEVFNLDTAKLTDVDKFKRRLIRNVARYIQEKVPEEEMWEKLQKDTDCDCYMLWKRMRSLTYKKLKRMLSVGDRWESVAKVARLSTTDWLLFDLVLVHEKVDFIGQDTMNEDKQEPKVLKELFELVKKHKIEKLQGEDLVREWVYLTLEYNKRGRQCSPMLMQRRWYQLKQLARIKFYNFWFAYRGSACKLEKALQHKPTELQAAIAKTYKFIVTDPFPEWEELVSSKKVVLREDFENLIKERPSDEIVSENVTDVQIIETPVETIELDDESDAENEDISQEKKILPTNDTHISDEPYTSNDKLQIRIDKIKSEIDQNVDIEGFENMNIPIQRENSPKSNELKPMGISTHEIPNELDNEVLPKITSVVGGVELLDSDDTVGDTQELVNNEDIKITEQITNLNESDNASTLPSNPIVTNSDDKLKSVDETQYYEVPLNNLLIIDDGIALEDDDEIYEDDMVRPNKEGPLQNIKEVPKFCAGEEMDETTNFDHKLLLTPVIYTKKLNDMCVFKFVDFNNVRDKRIIECCYIESKPKSELSISEKQKSKEHASKSIEHGNEEDFNTSAHMNLIPRIKTSSWLLQKPKKRSYNPIQLCKNPDFNTRLKRLCAGFFSCERNRLLLKECKPLTIDLHKSFEYKLIDGKMYLKDGKFTNNSERINTVCTKGLDLDPSNISGSSTVEESMSYIVPVISSTNTSYQKIDNTDMNLVNQNFNANIPTSTSTSDKKLLTVEITPIKANNIDNRPPVEIVAKRNLTNIDNRPPIEIVAKRNLTNIDNRPPVEIVAKRNLTNIDNRPPIEIVAKRNLTNIDNRPPIEIVAKRNLTNIDNRPPVEIVAQRNLTNIDNRPPVEIVAQRNLTNIDNRPPVEIVAKRNLTNIDNRPPVEIVAKRNLTNSDCLQAQEVLNPDQTPKGLHEKDNITENSGCIDLDHSKIKRRMSKNRFQNVLSKTIINGPKHYRFGYSINNRTREPVTWNMGRKTPKNTDIFGGVLLASDTLEKMLKLLLHGNVDDTKKKKKGEKSYAPKMKHLKEKIENKNEETTCMSTEKNKSVETSINTEKPIVKRGRKPKLREPDISQDIPKIEYCCWAKEKMATKREPKTPHYCPQPICICCCRDRLLEKTMGEMAKESWTRLQHIEMKMSNNKTTMSENTKKDLYLEITKSHLELSNKPTSDSTIVLSDDDDDIENTPKACQQSPDLVENINDGSIHLNMEKNTNNMDQNQEKSSNSEAPISLNHQISLQNNSLEEDTSMIQTNDKKLSPRIKLRVYSKSQPVLNKSTMNIIQDHTNSLQQSISNQYNNPHDTQHIKITNQHSNNEFPLSKISNPHENSEILLNTMAPYKFNSAKLPIFLGENKILLCENKGLSNLETNIIETPVETQSVLPQGVEIVLLPNGNLSLTIEPGKNFKKDELDKCSEILAAVKTRTSEILYLKNNNIINSLPQNENVSETLCDKQKSTSSKLSIETSFTTSTGQHVEDNYNTDRLNTQIAVGEINITSCNTHEAASDDHEAAKDSTDLALQSNKKSILHDLMEMSGISENDSVSDDKMQINTSKETLLPSTPVSTELPNNILAKHITFDLNTNLNDTINNQSVISKVLEKRKDLCVVSSIVELKAGCENKCQFYKMDTLTGQVVPVNIKVKKSNKRKQKIVPLIDSGSVIDLTDDTISAQEMTSKKTELDNSITSQIKPIKLIRRIRKKKEKSLSLATNKPISITPIKISKSLLKPDALISERSNVSTELNEISTHKNDTSDGAKTNDDRDSDSDDEPLAKIAKRQRDIGESDDVDKTASPENSFPGDIVDDDFTEYLIPEFLETMDCESNNEETEEMVLGV